ncbi:ribose-phosphate pyrophosphokinase [Rapidithrix thailandica]|uniref:ribose-phosphate diphosphokinase n=1 Tax=Rapidithrix thailandica TaxID=413964 RepID=A0AAW9SIM8_9BACT
MSLVKLFSGSATQYLAEKIAKAHGNPLEEVKLQRFSDGEIAPYYVESIRGHEVYLIQSTFSPTDNLMELLLMIDAAKRASAKTVSVIIPYFGYARQDRKDKPRVAIGAKLVANLLSAAGADRVVTSELHADQIQGFFDIPVVHLQTSGIFVEYLKGLQLDNYIFAAPDVGSVKRARRFAKYFNVEMVICDKHRSKANEIASMQVIGEVKGKHVVLVDDLIDTAGTMCRAAEALIEKGASSVRAICTHPVLSGPAYERIEDSVLQELVVTDTIPLQNSSGKIKVLSVADLFAEAIRRIDDNESVNSLFI